jgi:hypothetical protein
VKYMLLAYLPGDGTLPAEVARDYPRMSQAMRDAGVFVTAGLLQPAAAATTVRIRDGETMLTDGPFAEIKEQLGGYVLIECADLDEAVRWAGTVPVARHGSVEVRPIALSDSLS